MATQIDLPNATVYLFDFPISQSTYETIRTKTEWRQRTMLLYGKSVAQPRLTAWYGDDGAFYRYSGIRNDPLPWTPVLLELRKRIEDLLDVNFNSVLLNLYRNGRDSISLHSDDERQLGDEPIIASVSMGESRIMRFRHRSRQYEDRFVELTDGSLLLMMGQTQQNWLHGIDKTKQTGERINLTFRQISVD